MKELNCAPKYRNNKITCFSKNDLIKIANSYNKYYNDNINIPYDKKFDKKIFFENILEKIDKKNNCNNQYCLSKQNFISNKLKKKLDSKFIPTHPDSWLKNKFTWLSTLDINAVLKSYEKYYLDYLYVGAVPIDFDDKLMPGFCVVNELCNINLEKLYLKKGIRKIGIVFNLDPHYKSGSHWVSLYINLNNGGIYYFDSYGTIPKDEIKNLMEKIRIQGNNLLKNKFININNENKKNISFEIINNNTISSSNKININIPIYIDKKKYNIIDFKNENNNIYTLNKNIYTLNKNIKKSSQNILYQNLFRKYYNNIRFQYKNSECGVYSVFFQIELLRGINYVDFIKNIIDDDTINSFRNKFWKSSV